ncbi:MAG: peptidyl-prolyl cis-trans isomerase [Alphaproteobacteria bacterium]
MSFLARLLREPLVHFVLIGAAVFGLYILVGEGGDEEAVDNRIIVSEGRVKQLAQVFSKTWQRPPTPQELRGLIDAFVKEEVYYREAVKLSLDRDDTLIRRRMQQKMEFLTEPDEAALRADGAALQAYLDANKAAFRVEPRVAFEQVFINPKRSGEAADIRAKEALDALKTGASPGEVGDPTLLPAVMKLAAQSSVARDFGEAFGEQVTTLPVSTWIGPFESPFGLHLVHVTERKDGYDPPLAEVRDAVAQRWRTEKRNNFQREAYEKLLSQYDVVLPPAKEVPARDEPTP